MGGCCSTLSADVPPIVDTREVPSPQEQSPPGTVTPVPQVLNTSQQRGAQPRRESPQVGEVSLRDLTTPMSSPQDVQPMTNSKGLSRVPPPGSCVNSSAILFKGSASSGHRQTSGGECDPGRARRP